MRNNLNLENAKCKLGEYYVKRILEYNTEEYCDREKFCCAGNAMT